MKRVTPTDLRTRLYRILDEVAETGEPVEILRGGKVLRIVAGSAEQRTIDLEKLVSRPGAIVGDPDDLVSIDWSSEWKADDA